jgi:S-DNA-T family DNA segregation ATPase FtsK/SpoIIIE
MIINLIKSQQMFSLSLPEKVKGQYWLSDLDDSGDSRNLASIEAVGDRWMVKSSKWVDVLDAGGKAVRSAALVSRTLTYLQMKGSGDRAILFADEADESRLTFRKLTAGRPATFTLGRAAALSASLP